MKKNYIVRPAFYTSSVLFVLGTVVLLLVSSCKEKKKDMQHDDPGALTIDSNLSHLLKPSNEQVVSTLPEITAEYGSKIFTGEMQGIMSYDTRNEHYIASKVSGRIERLWIKYNYQPVSKGQLIMEIYSPDLAAAQQELLFISRNGHDPVMLEKGKQRLLLLGMTNSGIQSLLRTGQVNYRIPVYSNTSGYILEKTAPVPAAEAPMAAPASGGDGMDNMSGGGSAPASAPSAASTTPQSSPVLLREGQYVSAGQSLFTVYNQDRLVAEFSLKPDFAAQVKKGSKFLFYRTADKSKSQTAQIGLIQPVFKNGTNFTLARAYLSGSDIQAGELVTARIPVLIPASWWLPEAAVASIGNKKVAFKKEGNVFVPKILNTGINIGGMIQVKDDIGNWKISRNAAYLVDSESFIKMTNNTEH